jgi:hypothetical protein
MNAKQTDKPEWRLAGDLDNPDALVVLRGTESGRHQFLWLADRLFVFRRTVSDGGDSLLLEIIEGACIRKDDHLPEGTVCFTDPTRRAGYGETFMWRDKHRYEAVEVGLRPDVERLFFDGFMERARDKFI